VVAALVACAAPRANAAGAGPIVVVEATPTDIPPHYGISVDAGASIATTSPIESYTFDFDDGTQLTREQPTAFHVYAAARIVDGAFVPYYVTVTATDTLGRTGSATVPVLVRPPNHNPHADAGGPYVGVVGTGNSVTFTATGSVDADAIDPAIPNDIASYEWDFDNDGTTDATSKTPTVLVSDLVATYAMSVSGGSNGSTDNVVSLRVTDSATPVAGTDTATAVVRLYTTLKPDLVPRPMHGPLRAHPGMWWHATFSAANDGAAEAPGLWHEAVYYSTDTQLDASDTLLTTSAEAPPLRPAGRGHRGRA